MRHLLISFLAASLLFLSSTAFPNSRSAFFNLPSGARPVAMAGSYAAVADDTSALSTNPAGLLLAGNTLEFSANRWPGGAASDHVVANIDLKRLGCYGAGFNYYLLPPGLTTSRTVNSSYASYGSL